MKFRAKRPEKVVHEMDALASRYHRYSFQAVDNILNMDYFEKLLPLYSAHQTSYRMFFEVKSNLKKEHIKLLKEAGIYKIQPGIESLHSAILRLMNKGVHGTQNIALLRMARELNLDVVWNFLYGFPGETEQHYKEINQMIPKLLHLQPPRSNNRIRMDRFSPYFNDYFSGVQEGQTPRFRNVLPSPNYELVFPQEVESSQVAYFFDSQPVTEVSQSTYLEFIHQVSYWQEAWKNRQPKLRFLKGISSGHIIDERGETHEALQVEQSDFLVAKALENGAPNVKTIVDESRVLQTQVLEILHEFLQRGLVIEHDSKFVWLPTSER